MRLTKYEMATDAAYMAARRTRAERGTSVLRYQLLSFRASSNKIRGGVQDRRSAIQCSTGCYRALRKSALRVPWRQHPMINSHAKLARFVCRDRRVAGHRRRTGLSGELGGESPFILARVGEEGRIADRDCNDGKAEGFVSCCEQPAAARRCLYSAR